MSVLVVGLNHKTAPVGLLDQVAVPSQELPKALASLTGREHITEAVVLSTCNRVEVYARVSRYHGAMADIRDFFGEWAGIPPEDVADCAYDYYADAAASHLFAVTAGLDSMVVGERQVALQVKQAFHDAEAEGACGRMLQSLFQQALRVGKRVRAETGVSAGASSMVDVGLEAASRVLGNLAGSSVLIVGAGKMGGMAASRLHGLADRLVVTNRTRERAERLATRVDGEAADYGALAAHIREADLVLCSTSARQPVIDHDTATAAMEGRPDRPLALVDLAVPRDVQAECSIVPGVTVLDIDAISTLSGEEPSAGPEGTEAARAADELSAEVTAAQAIVDAEAERFAARLRSTRVAPTIAALRARAEQVRADEHDRLDSRLSELDERQRGAVEALTKGIVNTLLHEPTVRLKGIADARGGDEYAAALRELFDLPDDTE